MGMEKQGLKGGNHVGGFLQMFDWNVKSRKKLFLSKSDVPEQSKQKKRCDGNLPETRIQMLDEYENAGASSIKGSSDYSCASSVIDEDFSGTRAPGVVARLMGLDSLPKSNIFEPFSTPLFDSQSLCDADYRTRSLNHCQGQSVRSSRLQDVPVCNGTEPKYHKVMHRPIEKFQTEILPPKSAKSIPITHHKLLSPIKSGKFIQSMDASRIMEVAAKIIEPGPLASSKMKRPTVGYSSAPLKVRDLKEKVKAAQKQSTVFEGSQRKHGSSFRGHSMNNNSWSRAISVSEESSFGAKDKGKSISLALLAKANVKKREGTSVNSLASKKEPYEVSPEKLFKSQSTARKSVVKKQSNQNGSSVLRQNSQKQNCIIDRGKLPSKCSSKGIKTLGGESGSTAKQPNASKGSVTCKVGSRMLGSDVKDEKREISCSSTERITRKKRSIDGNYHSEKGKPSHNIPMEKNGKAIRSSGAFDSQDCWDQDSASTGTDVVSFTFTSPMTQSGTGSRRCTETAGKGKIFTPDSQSKMSPLSSDVMSALKFSFIGRDAKGSDALSALLEQKLKELSLKVELSQQKSWTGLHEVEPGLKAKISSEEQQEGNIINGKMSTDDEGMLGNISMGAGNMSQARKLLDCRLRSPVSVLEHFSFADSCNSSDTAESDSTISSKQCSTIQAQQVLNSHSLKTFLSIEGEADLSDSASSASAGTLKKMHEISLNKTGSRKVWELEYVQKIMCNIEHWFEDYALGRAHELISPCLSNQLGDWKGYSDDSVMPGINQRVLFECVTECLDVRCRHYLSGGFKLWAKGVSVVQRKERLAEEVYKEISDWSTVGDSMIDDLVDKDMSSHYGKWLDFDTESYELGVHIESRILNSLVDEVIADMLLV